jgi:Flp pilus assembly protein TadG
LFTFAGRKLSSFRNDERGATAMIFAISLFALVMMLGLAVDVARAIHTKTKISNALDGAALAAAKSLHDGRMSIADITALARRYFDANAMLNFGAIKDFQASIDKDNSTVRLVATADVPTAFARVGGFDKVTFPTTSAAAFDPKDIELGLSLDVTGSMCSPCTKIEDLRTAASDMVDILMPANKTSSNKVRIALAPFAAGVNAGAYALPATNKRASDTCVFERDGTNQATDAAPGAGDYLKVAGDRGVTDARNNCPSSAEVTALSDDNGALKRAIGRFRSGGSTAGHLGTAWAWYSVSPEWSSVWPVASRPVAYGDKKTIKAVVLMTDGVYNTYGGQCDRGCSNTSAQARNSQDVANRLCQNMKDKNVKVYSIGFKLDDRRAEDVLRDCASSALTFYRAENGDQLRDAFRQIAEDLLRLRLSQ